MAASLRADLPLAGRVIQASCSIGPTELSVAVVDTNAASNVRARLGLNRMSRAPSRQTYSGSKGAELIHLRRAPIVRKLELLACAGVTPQVHLPKKTTRICVDQG